MICEFALEPELVATWHNRKEYLFFEEKFGLNTKRIVSFYPKKWRTMVWKAFEKSEYSSNQNSQKRLDSLLNDLSQNAVIRRNTFTDYPSWLMRAEAEHAERPFHGIIATTNPRNKDHIIIATDLCQNGHPCWQIPNSPPVPRNTSELVAAVAPILRVCQHIVFIDPHFDPTSERFMKPMAGFFETIWEQRYGLDEPRVELHTAIERFFPRHSPQSRKQEEEERACRYLTNQLKTRLPSIIPTGKEVHVQIWKQREHGQKLHNRYILTEACGVAFGTGLDQNEDQQAADTDDIHMMDAAKHTIRWNQYLGNPAAFDTAVDMFTVIGS